MARDDDPQFMLRINAPNCNCFANCWPCPNHDFCANRNGRIVVSCTCTSSITQICGSNISFTHRQAPWSRFNGRFTVYRLITAHCPNVLQLETCRTFGEVQTVGRRWVLGCGCLISLICCEDPRPDGDLVYQDRFEEMNMVFSGLGDLVGGAQSEGRSESAGGNSGPTLQGSARYLPLQTGGRVNNVSQRSSGQTGHGQTVNGPGQSADQPIELESDDENIGDAPPPMTANQ